MRLIPTSIVALALLGATAGCGSSQDEETETRATQRDAMEVPAGAAARTCGEQPEGVVRLTASSVDCATGREVAAAWSAESSCDLPGGASRHSCRIDGWRCGSLVVSRGVVVSCARPGSSVAFLVRR